MLGKTGVLALCASAVLALSAGCTPDSPTAAGPDAQFDQSGFGAGGAATMPNPANATIPTVKEPTMYSP